VIPKRILMKTIRFLALSLFLTFAFSRLGKAQKINTVDTMEIYPLSDDSGYTVRTWEYPKDEKTKTFEYVSKIWSKTEGKWKISLLHSTAKEIPN
jgi:hypothetical protein